MVMESEHKGVKRRHGRAVNVLCWDSGNSWRQQGACHLYRLKSKRYAYTFLFVEF